MNIMCGMSTGKLQELDVDVSLGFYGGFLSIDTPDSKITYERRIQEPAQSPDEALNYLSQFSSQELAALIIQLIDNADEA